MSTELAKREAESVPELVQLAHDLPIENEDDLVLAADALGAIKARYKLLETERKKATAPMLEAKAVIDAWFRPHTTSLEKAETILKSKMREAKTLFDSQRAMEAAKRRLEAAAAVEADNIPGALEMVAEAVEMEAAPVVPGVQFRDNWTFEIEDTSQIPAQYLMVDVRAIGAAVKRGVREIPGVRIYQEYVVASTGRKA